MTQDQDELKEAEQYWQAFEIFRGKHTKRYRSTITVKKAGRITFNKSFIEEGKLDRAIFVSLLYSKGHQVIAFDFHDEKPDGIEVFKLARIGASKSNYSISATSFFKFYKLDLRKWAGTYQPESMLLGEDPPGPPLYRWQIALKNKDQGARA